MTKLTVAFRNFSNAPKNYFHPKLRLWTQLVRATPVPAMLWLTYGTVTRHTAVGAQRLTTNWAVRGSNAGGGEILHNRPDRQWGPPSLLYNGYRVFLLAVKQLGRGIDHSPPSSAEVKEIV